MLKNPHRYLLTAVVAATTGWLASQYAHTPKKAWIADVNVDQAADIVVESNGKYRSVIYGIPDSEQKLSIYDHRLENCSGASVSYINFISGEDLNARLEPQWKTYYKEQYNEEPSNTHYHYSSNWKQW